MRIIWISFVVLILSSPLPAVKESPSEPTEVVFLLHGLGRTHRSMKKLKKNLEKQGFAVKNLRYNSREKTVEILADQWLHSVLTTQGLDYKKRHFVTHSMGGILVRYYLQNHEIKNLGRVVMLAPPNQGCHVTDKLNKWGIYRWFTGPAGQELGTGEDGLPAQLKPIEAEIGIIAGTSSLNPFFSSLVPGPDDGKVAVGCTKLEEMKDFLVLPVTHTYIMTNKEVIRQSAFFLKKGRFNHSEN